MQDWTSNPTFVAYAISCLVLSANLLYLWAKSGTVRGLSKTVMNPEDKRTIAKGAAVVPVDPPEVARVLRAHANAMATFVPFAVLGLLYVMIGGAAGPARLIFGVFVASRVFHSFVYLREIQPWRTISFLIGGVALLGLLGDVTWILLV
jgi:microsomal prostaglandin-E synthase 1